MANLFARATANWGAANWNTAADGSGSSATPGASDVCMLNGFTVTLNTSVTVLEIRNDTTGGAAAGGKIAPTNTVVLTANLYQGSNNTSVFESLLASGSSCNVVGNVYGGTSGTGGALNHSGAGTVNLTGNVYGGTGGFGNRGAGNSSTGVLNITGDVFSGGTAQGLVNGATGTVNITGNVIAHETGAQPAVNNTAGGTVTVTGYVRSNDYGPGSTGISAGYGITNSAQGVVEVGETRSGARGLPAISGAYRYASTTALRDSVRATSGLAEVVLQPASASSGRRRISMAAGMGG